MQRAPATVGLLFGLSLAVLVILVGPLLLFNPWFTSALQSRHDVATELDTTRDEVDRVTGEILADLYTDGPFTVVLRSEEPLLDERERSHMHDVAVLVRVLAAVVILAVVMAGVTAAWLRSEPRRQGRIMLIAAGSVGALAILLAGIFAVAFEPAFLAFHTLFFPAGTYLFEPGSKLITLFPRGFWFDAALAAGAAVVVLALLVTVIGLRRWRGGGATPAPA